MLREKFCILICLIFAVVSCGGDDDDDDDEKETGDEIVTKKSICSKEQYQLVLNTSHNYEFHSSVDINVYEIQQYPNIPTINWSNLTKDIMGHDVDPRKDIGHIEIVLWNLDKYETFEEWINSDELEMDRLETMVHLEQDTIKNANMRASFEQFGSFGTDVDSEKYFHSMDPFPSDEFIFVLVLGRGTTIGYDAVTAAFLKPVESNDAQKDIVIDNDTLSIEYEATLNQDSYQVPKDGETIVDWTEMIGKTNAIGQKISPSHVGRVMLTFYKDKTKKELEKDFVNLETIADEKYTYDAKDPSPVSILSLEDENQNAFKGFHEEEGVWLLSLMCTNSCNNPAPKYIAALEPCK